MPAVVKCPNGCRLRVPARKLFDTFRCPKCESTLFVSKDEIEKFRADQKHVLLGNHSSDLVEVVSDDIVFLEGESSNLLVEIPDGIPEGSRGQKRPNAPAPPVPPPISSSNPNQGTSQTRNQPAGAPPELTPGNNRHGFKGPPDLSRQAENLESVDQTLLKEEGEIDRLEQKLAAEKSKRESLSSFGFQYFSKWFTDADNPGVIHKIDIRWKAYSLAWAMVVIGLFLLGPIVYTMLQWIGKDYHLPLGRWSLLLVFFSAFQFLYAIYLAQIPDWTTTRFVSYLMLGMTVFSSFILAIALLSQDGTGLFNFLQLSMTDKGKVAGWLCIMSIAFGLMSYLCGRTTQLWINEESRRSVAI